MRGVVFVRRADIVFVTNRPPAVDTANEGFGQGATDDRYRGVPSASEDPLVSADIFGDPRAARHPPGPDQRREYIRPGARHALHFCSVR